MIYIRVCNKYRMQLKEISMEQSPFKVTQFLNGLTDFGDPGINEMTLERCFKVEKPDLQIHL